MNDLYWIDLRYAVFGIEILKGKVVKTAPIGRWMIGKDISFIKKWVLKKNGIVNKL